ncbi:MAG: diguanylate cyclase [Bauldia sp.]
MELPGALDPAVARTIKTWEPLALAFSGAVAAAMIVTWPWRFGVAAGPVATWMGMPLGTAVGLLIATIALAAPHLTRSRRFALAMTGAMMALIVVSAAVFMAGLLGAALPVRFAPSPQTDLGLALLAFSICRCGTRLNRPAIDGVLLLLLGALLLFMLGGHLFGAASIVRSEDGRLASPASILVLALLSSVVTGRMTQPGAPLAILGQRGAGSRMIRLMIPVMVLVPFALFALVVWLFDSGTLGIATTAAIVAPALTIATFALMAWMGRSINRLEAGLRRESLTDRLTNVFNRAGLEAFATYLAAAASRTRTEILVLYLDLDDLKQVNDTLGHDVGSRLIRRFAGLLVETFRDNDVIARVGGDEFVVLANGNALDPVAMIARLETEAAAINGETSEPYRISFSAGFAFAHAADKAAVDEAISRADAFMYERKRLRKGVSAASDAAALREIAEAMAAEIDGGKDRRPLARSA